MATNLIIAGAIGAMLIASGTALNVSQHSAQAFGQMQNADSASLVNVISSAQKTTGQLQDSYPFASATPAAGGNEMTGMAQGQAVSPSMNG